MEIVKNTKNLIKKIFTKKEDKLDIILSMIDNITIDENTNMVHIKTNKNLVLENNGHTVMITKGVNVQLANIIHLNPKIDFTDKNFDELENRLDKAAQEAWEESQKQIENHACNDSH